MEKWERIQSGPFEPSWESLRQYECPQWFRDAKLGIWSHWGPQSVPMCGDWYARNMYIEGHEHYHHHWRVYGHPSKHGWKDVIGLWKAENFDPEALMQRYVDAGAKYFCATAMHHDNFDMWDSVHNPWNSVKMGPQKNILSLWQATAKQYGLPFGLTEHLGAAFSWWSHNKGCDKSGPYAGVPYDGNDPDYEDFYYPNQDEPILADQSERWYTDNAWFQAHWFDRMKDLVDRYQPDLLYSDGPVPFGRYGLGLIAHLYNLSAQRHDGRNKAVYNQKSINPLVYKIGVLDVECGVLGDGPHDPWQTDTCLGGWFYDTRQQYKSSRQIIEMLVDIVAKNGNLLLNIPLKPGGSLNDECVAILDDMAAWSKVHGEGIFETRPWHVSREGASSAEAGELKENAVEWTAQDFRFTCKENAIYAFQMAWPNDGTALVKSFTERRGSSGSQLQPVTIENVELLGYDGQLSFEYVDDGLLIRGLPEQRPVQCAHCFKITSGE